jgi:glycerol-3-phosphate dehydrogenase
VPRNQTEFSGIVPPAVSRAAVEQYCRNEWAVHLDDVMIRRSSWQHYHADRDNVARRACDWMAELLHWPDDQKQAEWDRYVRIARLETQIVHEQAVQQSATTTTTTTTRGEQQPCPQLSPT